MKKKITVGKLSSPKTSGDSSPHLEDYLTTPPHRRILDDQLTLFEVVNEFIKKMLGMKLRMNLHESIAKNRHNHRHPGDA